MKSPRISLKTQFLLLSVLILVIPWAGYRYVQGMETFLKSNMEETIANHAHAVAMVLHQSKDFIAPHMSGTTDSQNSEHLYLRSLENPIHLDGYTDDWHFNQDLFQEYSEQHVIRKSDRHRPGSLQFSQATGRYKQHLYAVFRVRDEHISYHKPGDTTVNHCDHLRIGMMTPDNNFVRYTMSTVAPGRLSAQRMSNEADDGAALATETRIQGVWQETAEGYTLELRIPLSMIGNKLSFAISDIDDPQSKGGASIIGASSTEQYSQLSTIMVPSQKLEKQLMSLAIASSRIWIIDKDKRVLAMSGKLETLTSPHDDSRSVPAKIMSLIYRLIMRQPNEAFEDALSGVSKLNGREIESALQGQAAVSWRETSDKHATILTASHPLLEDDKVIGAVMVEQNSQRILILQNRATEELLNISLAVFVGGTILIILFAGYLTSRIRYLRNQTEKAITHEGKLIHVFEPSNTNDEIGDLSRTFADLLERLHHYNRYLEGMAGKLSHELRTPLSIVRSSLDNLEQLNPETSDDTYLRRAQEGLARLNDILNRLSEATRLEQALQQADKEVVDISQLLKDCVDGYRSVYPQQAFMLQTPERSLYALVAPELIVQMLDKLIANAVDFAQQDTAIEITVSADNDDMLRLDIFNHGPQLPQEMHPNLFDSMVSVRPQSTRGSHLGLGLYIVRLITEYHHGQVEAHNRSTPDGVLISVYLNLHSAKID